MDPYFCDSEEILQLATPEDLIRAGNAPYLDARSMIENLQAELVKYKVALQTTQEIHQNAIRMGIGAASAPSQMSQSNACETPATSVYNLLKPDQGLPAPLQREEYAHVRFWRREQYDKWLKMNKGDTNGLAAEKPKRGRPRKSENEEEDNVHHPYLETVSGLLVNSVYLYKLSVKARRIWATLLKFGQAPDSYSEMDELSREYFIREMCEGFFELCLCSDFWKLDLWLQKNYASWARTHLKSKREKKEAGKRQKNGMVSGSSDENAVAGLVAGSTAPASTNLDSIPTSTVPASTNSNASTAPASIDSNNMPASTAPVTVNNLPASTNNAPASTNSNTMLASTAPASTDSNIMSASIAPTSTDSNTMSISTAPASTDSNNMPALTASVSTKEVASTTSSSVNIPGTGSSEPSPPPSSSPASPSSDLTCSEDHLSGTSTGNTGISEDSRSSNPFSGFDDPCDDDAFIRRMEQRAAASASALVAAQSTAPGGDGTEGGINELQSQTTRSGTARKRTQGDDADGRQKKRSNIPAVVGPGKTAKNFCMAEWLKTNMNGTKDDFDKYFHTLTKEQVRPFEDAARDAINAAAREKRKAKKTVN